MRKILVIGLAALLVVSTGLAVLAGSHANPGQDGKIYPGTDSNAVNNSPVFESNEDVKTAADTVEDKNKNVESEGDEPWNNTFETPSE